MTNGEVVVKVLAEYSCLSAMEVKQFAKRMFDYDISPQAVGGIMRRLISRGFAASGKSPYTGKSVYWLNKQIIDDFKVANKEML